MPEVKVSLGCISSQGSRGGSFLPLPASGAPGVPWACSTSLPSLIPSSCSSSSVSVSSSVSYKDTGHWI